jgi:hypothetical protein
VGAASSNGFSSASNRSEMDGMAFLIDHQHLTQVFEINIRNIPINRLQFKKKVVTSFLPSRCPRQERFQGCKSRKASVASENSPSRRS